MRLLYATSIRFPSPLANRIQILETSKEFFGALKNDFILGIGENNGDMVIPCPSLSTGANIRSFRLAKIYLTYAFKNKFDTVFCREEKLLFFMIVYKILLFWMPSTNFIFEVHDLNNRHKSWYKFILSRVQKIVVISQGLKSILIKEGIKESKIIVAPDAVDLAKFDIDLDKMSARQKLELPEDKIIILCNGSLEAWKGIDTFYKASNHFNDLYLFLNVGGRATWVKEFEGWYPPKKNFSLLGHKDHKEIPVYLKAADVLVIPNSAKLEISNIATSPMKLFEYMASGRPMVASNIPSIREIVDQESAFLVKPDDEIALAEGIKHVLKNEDLSKQMALSAYRKVQKYTWHARVQEILKYLK